MTTQEQDNFTKGTHEAFSEAQETPHAVNDRTQETASVVDRLIPTLHRWVEQGTETIGKVVAPIVDNPVTRFATQVPGINWLMAALGQVDGALVQREVTALRQQFPLDTQEQLAQRVMASSAWKAAGIGLLTNAIPPIALMFLAVDIGAIAALQANMIYRIAAIYGFAPTDSTRRGEVLTLWGLSTGGSGVLKTGLSLVEIVPGVGTLVGITSDAALLYGIGHLACRFYEEKQKAQQPPEL